MSQIHSIGGYFGLELPKGEHFHKKALQLNTGRNCFEYVLRVRKYDKIYLPYYTCEVMLEPVHKLDVDYEFYHINDLLEPGSSPKLKINEAFLYTNYYGLKQSCVNRLSELYGDRLIIDNSQAFYSEPIKGVDTFYSARKFFGVADGAYLYTKHKLNQEFEQDFSFERMSHLLKRTDIDAEAGYQDFRRNDDSLCNQEIKRMSNLTERILSGIDYEWVKNRRRANYCFLDCELRRKNLIHFELDDNAVPMVYPFLTEDSSLKQKLIENKVYVATYWSNVKGWIASGTLEHELVDKLIPIPCDQRYDIQMLNRIVGLMA